jgi:uncharacterized membrane protein YraQ (UPF0718 family)
MPRGAVIDASTLIMFAFAAILTVIAYFKDPGLPWIGARNGFALIWFVLPRLIAALILTGMLQVLVPQELISRHFGREVGWKGLVIATVAGVITPGGPMVSVPLMVALANSGAGMATLVTYITSWSLFGIHRIIAWEAPLMGWQFVAVRSLATLAFPVLAGWLVKLFYPE